MSYIKYGMLAFLGVLVLTGCRSQNVETVTDPGYQAGQEAATQIVAETETLPTPAVRDAIANNQTNTAVVEQAIPDSFIGQAGNYEDITFIDSSDWVIYQNFDVGMSFWYPNGFGAFEVIPGEFLLTSEGTGDFFAIYAQAEDIGVPVGADLQRSYAILNNQGLEMTVEEYLSLSSTRIVSYVVEKNNLVYRFVFEYFEGDEDYLDLFVQTMGTVQI
jgi:hypothetical protein